MKEAPHIIQKTLFNVTVPATGTTKEVEHFVDDLLQNKLMRELDVVLTKYSKSADYICFDRIKIDLGNIDLQLSDEEIVRKICTQLSFFLEEQTSTLSGNPHGHRRNAASSNATTSHKEELGQRAVNHLTFFLKNGFFPWNAISRDLAELEKMVIKQISTNQTLKKEMMEALNASRISIRRMALQTSTDFFLSFIEIYKMQPTLYGKCLKHIELITHTLQETSIPLSAFREVYLSTLMHSGRPIKGTEEEMLAHFLHKISADRNLNPMDILHQAMASFHSSIPQNTKGQKKTLELLKTIKAKNLTGTAKTELTKNTQSIIIHQDDVLKRLNTLTNKHLEIKSTAYDQKSFEGGAFHKNHAKAQHTSQLPNALEEIYVADAGIAIIHPFLPALFRNLGVINNNGLIDHPSKQKAVNLLGYICSGAHQITENRLTVAKLLCGIDIQTPLDREVSLSVSEKREVEQMLLSVIRHWTILKNTSIETFRESFINRSGILKHNTTEWLLSIEQRPFDLLFNYLPWNISMIYYSWMKSMIKVTISNTKT